MVKELARAPSTVSRAEAFQDLQAHGYGTATHNDRLDCFDWASAQKRDDFARAVSSNGFLWKGEPVTLNSQDFSKYEREQYVFSFYDLHVRGCYLIAFYSCRPVSKLQEREMGVNTKQEHGRQQTRQDRVRSEGTF